MAERQLPDMDSRRERHQWESWYDRIENLAGRGFPLRSRFVERLATDLGISTEEANTIIDDISNGLISKREFVRFAMPDTGPGGGAPGTGDATVDPDTGFASGGVDVHEFEEGTLMSGVPLEFQNLRRALISLFLGTLAHGMGQDEEMAGLPFFGDFMRGIPGFPGQEGAAPPQQDTTPGPGAGPGGGGGPSIVDDPGPLPPDQLEPPVVDPGGNQDWAGAMMDPNVIGMLLGGDPGSPPLVDTQPVGGQGTTGGVPHFQRRVPRPATATMMDAPGPSPYSAGKRARFGSRAFPSGPSFGLAELSLLSGILSAGTSAYRNLRGSDDAPQQMLGRNMDMSTGGGSPTSMMFSDPMSNINMFMQILQSMGPEIAGPRARRPGEPSPFSAGPPQVHTGNTPKGWGEGANIQGGFSVPDRDMFRNLGSGAGEDPAISDPTPDPEHGGPGAGGNPWDMLTGVDNEVFSRMAGLFSLPAYQGPVGAPATGAQRQATRFAENLLDADPFGAQANLEQTINEMIETGGRFDHTEEFDALEDRSARQLEQQMAQAREQFGARGLRFGTDMARGEAQLRADTLERQAHQRAQIARESFEAAQGRRMQALTVPEQIRTAQMQAAERLFGMGQQEQLAQERAIQREMAEFARTQGALFPLMVQFALAGFDGDLWSPNPIEVE